MGADLTFQPAKQKQLAQREEALAVQSRAKLALAIRSALQTREGRFLARWFLRLADGNRSELAPTSGVFNPNAMSMAHQDGELSPIRKAWTELGEMARTERGLMEQEDHDERSHVHTN